MINKLLKEREEDFENEILYSFPCTVEPQSVIGYATSVDGDKTPQAYKGKAINIKSHNKQTNKLLIEKVKEEIQDELNEIIAPHGFSLEDAVFLKRAFNKVFNKK